MTTRIKWNVFWIRQRGSRDNLSIVSLGGGVVRAEMVVAECPGKEAREGAMVSKRGAGETGW